VDAFIRRHGETAKTFCSLCLTPMALLTVARGDKQPQRVFPLAEAGVDITVSPVVARICAAITARRDLGGHPPRKRGPSGDRLRVQVATYRRPPWRVGLRGARS